MANLGEVFSEIREAGRDVLSLDVVTLTGKIQVTTTASGEIDLSAIYKTLSENAKTKSDMEVVAFSHISLDRDAVQFVKSGLGEGEQPLVEAHVAMVAASQEARLAMIRTVKDLVGI